MTLQMTSLSANKLYHDKAFSNDEPCNDEPPNDEPATKAKKEKRLTIKRRPEGTEKCNIHLLL